MIYPVIMNKEDCYCNLSTFYENAARIMGVKTDSDTQFDCRKICVTMPVQETIWSYYREELHMPDDEIARILLLYGPKANVEEHGILEYRAEVENGFITTEHKDD